MSTTTTGGEQSAPAPTKNENLYRWNDPDFDKSRDIMHTPGTKQYLGPSPGDEQAHGLPNAFPREVVERHR